MSSYIPAVAATLLPFTGVCAGMVAAKTCSFQKYAENPWVESLKRPWDMPKWLIGPLAIGLYSSIGYASYLVWRDGGGFNDTTKYPLMLYGTQLALNWAWGPVFYGMNSMKAGAVNISLVTACVAACAYEFYKINSTAGHIFSAYFTWLTVATYTVYCIWRDNPDKR